MAAAISPERIARFRKLLEVHSVADAARIIKICPTTAWAIVRRNFEPRTIGVPPKPVPADLSLNADTMTIKELMRHYHVNSRQLHRMLAEAGIERRYKSIKHPEPLPVPPRDVIVDAIKRYGIKGAYEHMGVAHTTFRAWRRHHGLTIHTKTVVKRAQVQSAKGFGWVDRYAQGAQACR